jgi:hypothetical protein
MRERERTTIAATRGIATTASAISSARQRTSWGGCGRYTDADSWIFLPSGPAQVGVGTRVDHPPDYDRFEGHERERS